MAESPIDVPDRVFWVTIPDRAGREPDPAHVAQMEERDRVLTGSRPFGGGRERIQQAWGAAGDSTRGLLDVLGELVHELEPLHRARIESEVRHFAWCSFEELTDAIRSGPVDVKVGRVRFRCGPGRMKRNPRQFEADGRLRLPVSRPDLPVRLVVEPWWSTRTAVTLSLRPSRRLRYPRRYFDAAHGVVAGLIASCDSR
jgi:hypothetical protein